MSPQIKLHKTSISFSYFSYLKGGGRFFSFLKFKSKPNKEHKIVMIIVMNHFFLKKTIAKDKVVNHIDFSICEYEGTKLKSNYEI
jgi:hypothetical protein